ncbi:MAG: class I SAM-dependent methyltransferase [Phycisphaeraceae bacterium]|nr:class I SAM-dependent methyltransferase [Phycisphaeraceae bacterium]
MQTESATDNIVTFINSQGETARGTLVRLSRNQAVFEVYNPYSIIQLSEVLDHLEIRRGERVIYSGRAVASGLVTTGLMLIVSATLVDPWSDLVGLEPGPKLRQEVEAFVSDWDSRYGVLSDRYKSTIGEMRNFFEELSRWLNHSETAAGIDSRTPERVVDEFTRDVSAHTDPKIGNLCTEFEQIAAETDSAALSAHKEFARRELHPLILCSPFIHRTFSKPLGYAGDYEMVNQMFGEPWRGQSTYAKIVNAIIIKSDGAEGHRNRVDRLEMHLRQETRRVTARESRPLRVLNIGCGPAIEVQRFIQHGPDADKAYLDLMDFNDETLAYTTEQLFSAKKSVSRSTQIRMVHESIHGLLKGNGQALLDGDNEPLEERYDYVYCAGLFDYISDRICKRLMRMFYSWTKPGGLLLATNVHPRNPVRHFIEHLLEWNLIYRDEDQMTSLSPDPLNSQLFVEETGVNIFVEVRKPGPLE